MHVIIFQDKMKLSKAYEIIKRCAMRWIQWVRTLLPPELIQDPTLKDNDGRTCAKDENLVKTLPPELIHEPTLQDESCQTCAMNYIRLVKLFPPETLLDSRCNNANAMRWIKHFKTLPPKEIWPWSCGDYEMTCAMWWICSVKTLPPPELRHDASLQDNDGMTCAMYWIEEVKTLPPPELRHDPHIQDKDGWTCARYWKKYVREPVPPELL